MPPGLPTQLASKWSGKCIHPSNDSLCPHCCAAAIHEALALAEKVAPHPCPACGHEECTGVRRKEAAIAALRGTP